MLSNSPPLLSLGPAAWQLHVDGKPFHDLHIQRRTSCMWPRRYCMNSRAIVESTVKLHSYTTRLSAPAWPAWIILISNDVRVSVDIAGWAAMVAYWCSSGGAKCHSGFEECALGAAHKLSSPRSTCRFVM